jgi:hypothetical protein
MDEIVALDVRERYVLRLQFLVKGRANAGNFG